MAPADHEVIGFQADAQFFQDAESLESTKNYARALSLARGALEVNPGDGNVRALIGHYLAVLSENGVAAPGPAAAWEEHRLFALYAWIAISVTAATTGLQDREIVARAIESVGRGVEDLDSLAALDELVSRAGGAGSSHDA